ncbi:hypothetical protein E4T43_06521 [Aureobasidium subglaciale]|nr:hypothetical protein E4T43_06521 [Aureobasidium subglaciale]
MLEGLPVEVIQLVFKQLATTPELIHYDNVEQNTYHRNSWKALAQLCKVSRQIKSIAEPLLYQNYAKPDSSSNPVAHYSFRKFLATVLRRPELLKHVCSLYIGAWRHYPERELQRAAKSKLTACTARVCDTHFSAGLHSLYNKYANVSVLGNEWKEALDAGEEVAEIALLMSLTPNLERIEFSMPHLSLNLTHASPRYFWPRLLAASAGWNPSTHFHRLDCVMVHKRNLIPTLPESAEYGFEIDPFLPFIGLPKLKVFWVESDNYGSYRKLSEEYPLNEEESHLTDLTLGLSYIHPMKLVQILKRCTKLEAFVCDFQPELIYIPGFSWITIGEALEGSRQTLEELTLGADMSSQLATEEFTGSEGTCVSIGSLKKFTSLRKLDVLQTTLLGFENMIDEMNLVVPASPFRDMLPSSLESLTIDICTLTIVPYLESMLATLRQNFPYLQEMRLSDIDLMEFDTNNRTGQQFEVLMQGRRDRVKLLKEGFVQAGVKLR